MKTIRGLYDALLLLWAAVVIGVVGVGCAENADQPLLETTPELQSSLSALSQTNVPQAFHTICSLKCDSLPAIRQDFQFLLSVS